MGQTGKRDKREAMAFAETQRNDDDRSAKEPASEKKRNNERLQREADKIVANGINSSERRKVRRRGGSGRIMSTLQGFNEHPTGRSRMMTKNTKNSRLKRLALIGVGNLWTSVRQDGWEMDGVGVDYDG
ncbi:hypothetical protein R1flu_004673 [Riccia fluitans]|uniref:Uncharacterized protein n=1 Tax=Riccia fluitans TaxID=41844 RepID=A0ABD1YRY9_9MARC